MERRVLTGYIPSPTDERDYKLDRVLGASKIVLPKKYSSRSKLGNRILNQYNTEACVGFTMAATAQALHYIQTGESIEMAPMYPYGHREDTDYQGEGLVTRETLKNWQKYGICPKKDFDVFTQNMTFEQAKAAYEANKDKCDKAAKEQHISSYYRLNEMEEIKKAIYTIGFAWVAIDVYDCIYDVKSDGIVHYNFFTRGKCWGGHQVYVTGWDEDDTLETDNSWGTEFGHNGLMYLPKSYEKSESWGVVDTYTEKKIAQQYS